MAINDTRCTFGCVNLITVQIYYACVFLLPEKEFYYAKKSIPKNDIRTYHSCDYRSRLRLLQSVCNPRRNVYDAYGEKAVCLPQ